MKEQEVHNNFETDKLNQAHHHEIQSLIKHNEDTLNKVDTEWKTKLRVILEKVKELNKLKVKVEEEVQKLKESERI